MSQTSKLERQLGSEELWKNKTLNYQQSECRIQFLPIFLSPKTEQRAKSAYGDQQNMNENDMNNT